MNKHKELEDLITHNLGVRGLTRAPGEFAFVHAGQKVALSIDESVYTGHFLTVHDGSKSPRQFRARAGNYDWNAIATLMTQIAEGRAQRSAAPRPAVVARGNEVEVDLSAHGSGPSSRMLLQPSPGSAGRVKLNLQDVELDPVSVMQIYAIVKRAAPSASAGTPPVRSTREPSSRR